MSAAGHPAFMIIESANVAVRCPFGCWQFVLLYVGSAPCRTQSACRAVAEDAQRPPQVKTAMPTLPPPLTTSGACRACDTAPNVSGSVPFVGCRAAADDDDCAVRLQKLLIQHNCLESIPDEISKLGRLGTLQVISHPPISLVRVLRDQISTSGMYVQLHCNRLKQLPHGVGELTRLSHLSLHHNELESVPAELSFVTRLETLQLSHNQLSTLPDSLSSVRRCKSLFG